MIKIFLKDGAQIPTRGSEEAAGLDLYLLQNTMLTRFEIAKLDTGVIVQPPVGMYTEIKSRSSTFLNGITVHNGVIDRDYTGTIKILVRNNSPTPVLLFKETPIAQMIVKRYVDCCYALVNELDIKETMRGDDGFGSSNHKTKIPVSFDFDYTKKQLNL